MPSETPDTQAAQDALQALHAFAEGTGHTETSFPDGLLVRARQAIDALLRAQHPKADEFQKRLPALERAAREGSVLRCLHTLRLYVEGGEEKISAEYEDAEGCELLYAEVEDAFTAARKAGVDMDQYDEQRWQLEADMLAHTYLVALGKIADTDPFNVAMDFQSVIEDATKREVDLRIYNDVELLPDFRAALAQTELQNARVAQDLLVHWFNCLAHALAQAPDVKNFASWMNLAVSVLEHLDIPLSHPQIFLPYTRQLESTDAQKKGHAETNPTYTVEKLLMTGVSADRNASRRLIADALELAQQLDFVPHAQTWAKFFAAAWAERQTITAENLTEFLASVEDLQMLSQQAGYEFPDAFRMAVAKEVWGRFADRMWNMDVAGEEEYVRNLRRALAAVLTTEQYTEQCANYLQLLGTSAAKVESSSWQTVLEREFS